jgi:hypothetical protein
MRPSHSIALAAGAGLLLVTGCARRPHTRSDYGVPNHVFFDRQAQAAARGSAQGLDSEEAAAIHQHYGQTLGRRGTAPRNDPGSSVLILGEDRNASKKP